MARPLHATLSLVWWLFLLSALEGASLFLDAYHYLTWGQLGVALLKTGYLAFAALLCIRYLSFRSQKAFESMVDSYNRLSSRPWEPGQNPKDSRFKPVFYLVLTVLSAWNFLTPFRWSESVFRHSILLDLAVWCLLIFWIGRAHWLKTLGRRERLKEGLDDARSRSGSTIEGIPPLTGLPGRRLAVYLLSAIALVPAGAVSWHRWSAASRVYRLDELKGCMGRCLGLGLDRFYEYGLLAGEISREPCLEAHRERIRVTLGLQEGAVFLRADEEASADFFGNGVAGDEGLILEGGRFRKALRGKAPESR